VRALEREALALQMRAAFAEEGTHVPSVAEVIAEFDRWLLEDATVPQAASVTDVERDELFELIGVRRRD
jgi:hypothetical protein